MRNISKLEIILTILIVFMTLIALTSSILFIIKSLPEKDKLVYLITACISLFFIGLLVMVIVLRNDENKDVYKYVIMDKDEYEIIKNTLYDQKREIKKLMTTIKNK